MFGLRKKQSSIKETWNELYSRGGVESHEEILENDTIWRDYDRSMSPDLQAEDGIDAGIEILCGSENWALARRFFERSKEVIETIIKEDLLPRTEAYSPRNRASLHRAKVYADSLLGQRWNCELLCSASCDFEEDCRLRYPDASDWDFLPQFQYITAVHMALLGDDLDRAEQLLNDPPYPLDVYVEHVDLLRGLIQIARHEFTDEQQAHFIVGYDAFFDKLRDPRWKKQNGFTIKRLGQVEFSLLREKYIRNPDIDIDWQRAINEFSKD